VWLSTALAAPLARLRLAFIALGASLLLTVSGLLHSALSRLEEQRALRHRMVAERVFDEVEREISTVLQHEAERPSDAYDPLVTDPSRWSRFVVGYYRKDPQLQLVAEASLDETRAQRLRQAVWRSESALALAMARLEAARIKHEADHKANPDGVAHRAAEPARVRIATRSPDVLRQLNRGVKVRERRMHDFLTSFAVVRADPSSIVAQRQGLEQDRVEGLVIDVPILVETIQAWVLGSQGLNQLAALTTLPNAAPPTAAARYDFRHRLAAPFEAYEVSLRLARLDDEDAGSTLYKFAGLFALAAALGLFAIWRTVVVQVRFAERRNNFVAAVTHELRTPLTSIRMYGEMLRDGMVHDEQTRQEYYATITAEGERLTRLINNVMEHGRLRRGQRHAHVERRDAVAVVREVMELMKPHIEREGFSLHLMAAENLPEIQLDVDAFKQVLFNVIDNALKYGRGGGTAKLEVACLANAKDGVVVSVRDHGPGVAEDHMSVIFEPFLRGGSELTRRHQGTGLGLALVRDLVELMHGSVQALNRAPGFELRIELRAARQADATGP
jgi:signal transduction histidine kinase